MQNAVTHLKSSLISCMRINALCHLELFIKCQRFYNYIIWYKKSSCILYDIVLLPVKFQDVCDTRITPDQNDQ